LRTCLLHCPAFSRPISASFEDTARGAPRMAKEGKPHGIISRRMAWMLPSKRCGGTTRASPLVAPLFTITAEAIPHRSTNRCSSRNADRVFNVVPSTCVRASYCLTWEQGSQGSMRATLNDTKCTKTHQQKRCLIYQAVRSIGCIWCRDGINQVSSNEGKSLSHGPQLAYRWAN